MNKAVVYIGVDVAKASLDVAWAERSVALPTIKAD